MIFRKSQIILVDKAKTFSKFSLIWWSIIKFVHDQNCHCHKLSFESFDFVIGVRPTTLTLSYSKKSLPTLIIYFKLNSNLSFPTFLVVLKPWTKVQKELFLKG